MIESLVHALKALLHGLALVFELFLQMVSKSSLAKGMGCSPDGEFHLEAYVLHGEKSRQRAVQRVLGRGRMSKRLNR